MTTDPKECSENAKRCVALVTKRQTLLCSDAFWRLPMGGCGLLSISPKWTLRKSAEPKDKLVA